MYPILLSHVLFLPKSHTAADTADAASEIGLLYAVWFEQMLLLLLMLLVELLVMYLLKAPMRKITVVYETCFDSLYPKEDDLAANSWFQ